MDANTTTITRYPSPSVSGWLAGILICCCIPAIAQHYEFSEGLYRIAYENNIIVNVVSDVYTHDPLGKYDITTSAFDPDIVAAAAGWVRWIQEDFDTACATVVNNQITSCCWQFNNYVIIEHPNGEWSQYTHIQHGSASAAGIEVGDWVAAGAVIGVEGTVGCSTGDHLHLELSRPFDPATPFDTVGGFLNNFGEMLIPVTCGIQPNVPWLSDGNVRIAKPCNDACPTTSEVNGSVGSGGGFIARADNYVTTGTANPVVFSNGSTTQFRAGNYIVLNPGFHIQAGAKFSTVLRDCNE